MTFTPLETTYAPGDTGHSGAHNAADTAINDLETRTAALEAGGGGGGGGGLVLEWIDGFYDATTHVYQELRTSSTTALFVGTDNAGVLIHPSSADITYWAVASDPGTGVPAPRNVYACTVQDTTTGYTDHSSGFGPMEPFTGFAPGEQDGSGNTVVGEVAVLGISLASTRITMTVWAKSGAPA